MRRMKKRLEDAERLYFCVPWSEKFARLQWRYAIHISELSSESWASKISQFSYGDQNDEFAEYLRNRNPGRPNMRWDDYLYNFCTSIWQEFNHLHWTSILKLVNASNYEDSFVAFILQ